MPIFPVIPGITGPGTSTDHALVRMDGTTGQIVQNSVGILTDAGVLSGITVADPTTDQQPASKLYVDNAAAAGGAILVALYTITASSANLSIAAASTEFLDFDTAIVSSGQWERDSSTYCRYRVPSTRQGKYKAEMSIMLDSTTTSAHNERMDLYTLKNGTSVGSYTHTLGVGGTAAYYTLQFRFVATGLVTDDLLSFSLRNYHASAARVIYSGSGCEKQIQLAIYYLGA